MGAYGIVILAAGTSSRLGKPKQLLPFEESNLLQHTINIAVHVAGKQVQVVLGSNKEEIQAAVTISEDQVVVNDDYEKGMGSSLVVGLSSLLNKFPTLAAVIFVVCDQPFLSSAHLHKMMEVHEESGMGIIASLYDQTRGVPVLFDQKYYHELQELTGEEGAKKLVYRWLSDVFDVPFPEGSVDIDTIEDYQAIISKL